MKELMLLGAGIVIGVIVSNCRASSRAAMAETEFLRNKVAEQEKNKNA